MNADFLRQSRKKDIRPLRSFCKVSRGPWSFFCDLDAGLERGNCVEPLIVAADKNKPETSESCSEIP